MTKINRSAIVPYSQQRMYDLVVDMPAYPEFLPWCNQVEILSSDEGQKTVRLDISFKGIKQHFTTKNHNNPCDQVTMELVDGPFNHLTGQWRFIPLSESACKIALDLEFTFSNRLLEKVVGPVFGLIGNTMVDSFYTRAKELYGVTKLD